MTKIEFFKNLDGKEGSYVVTDVGNILKVKLNNHDMDGTISPMQGCLWIDTIITDDDIYGFWGEKKYLPIIGGTVLIDCEKNKECSLCSDPRVLYLADRNWEMFAGINPVKEEWRKITDKIGDEYFKAKKRNDEKEIDRLGKQLIERAKTKYPTKEEWERFCLDIPTREQALKWLDKRWYQIEPIDIYSEQGYANSDKYDEKYSYMPPGTKALDFGNY